MSHENQPPMGEHPHGNAHGPEFQPSQQWQPPSSRSQWGAPPSDQTTRLWDAPQNQQSGWQPAPEPQQPKKKSGGKLAAGALALALMSAVVGGGTGIAVDRYLAGRDEPTVIEQNADSEKGAKIEEQSEETSPTVQQATPSAPDWTVVADAASDSVVAITVVTGQGGGQGSGVVIDKQGNIVTNNHVVSGAKQMLVTLNDYQYTAEIVGTDPSTDLAVIRLTDPPSDLTPMSWGKSNELVVGDPVMAIGNPLGLSNTVTTGIVSALDRPVATEAVGETDPNSAVVTAAIQTNAAINPGNSGGALVNASGELIGITTAIASMPTAGGGQSGNIGIGFAIGSEQARNVAEEIIENGKAQHPQVGVTARDVQEVGPMGAEVVTVVPDSPAASAGLQPGDVITAVNERPVSTTQQLVGLVRAQKVGEEISITFVRDGEEQTAAITPSAAQR